MRENRDRETETERQRQRERETERQRERGGMGLHRHGDCAKQAMQNAYLASCLLPSFGRNVKNELPTLRCGQN